MLFAVCSRPRIEKPSCFFFSRKFFILSTGTSTIGTHLSAVTLIKQRWLAANIYHCHERMMYHIDETNQRTTKDDQEMKIKSEII